MTKKTISIVIVFVMLVTLLSGCTLIQLNTGREANQVLATINYSGMSTTVKQNEMLDYFNSNASNIMQNYGYTVMEAFNYLFEKKVESKYLVLNGIKYLSDTDTLTKRKGLLYGGSNITTAEGALTAGERYYAIKTINEQIQTTIDSFIDEYKLEAKRTKINKIDKTKIAEVKIQSNKLREVYYKDDKLDLDTIELEITFTDESGLEKAVIPVTEDMFVTKFDSAAAGKKKLVIGFDKIEYNEDGEEVFVQLKDEYDYEVKDPRATKAENEEEKDEIEDRYVAEADIKEENKYVRLTLDQDSGDRYTKDAYRRLKTNLENQNRDLEYFYQTGFETVLMSAMQYEIGEKAIIDSPIPEANIVSEYEYLKTKSEKVFTDLSTDQKKLEKVNELIGSNLNALYYFPSVAELPAMKDFFYVDQILINFSEEQKAFLKNFIGSDDEKNKIFYEMVKAEVKTSESNTKYDVEYDCPKHEGGDKDAICKFKEEDAANDEINCPSNAYVKSDIAFGDVFNALESALKSETDAQKRLAIFDEYKYKYNDDPGIMNNNTGYLMPPKTVKSSWMKGFSDLGYKLYDDAIANGEGLIGKALIDNKLQYAFTDYGIHIIMISKTPFRDIDQNANSFDINAALDSIGTSFTKNIQKQLKDELKTKAYTDYVLALIENKIIDDKKIVVVDQKKVDKLLKPYKDLEK